MSTRILFVAENVTLAQIVRIATLARSLPPDRYDVHFASSSFPELVFAGTDFEQHAIETLAAERAAKALESGRRLYDKKTLQRYVAAELALMDRVEPDVVVGDFRLSLSTSAQLAGVPCGVLINAYWSPFAVRERWPVPDHPIVRLVGEELAERYFPKALPRAFEHFASPVNATRRRLGLPPVGSLQEVLTQGDYTLYPDDPWLTPVQGEPAQHRFLGPVLWEPSLATPQFGFDDERPLVYVTLGSSGKVDLLPLVVEAVASLPVNVVVATAGRAELANLPPNVRAYPYVPGSELARRAAVVVSNGGSTTGYQALREGTPVVGLPTNLDQYLATQALVARGVGLEVKARNADLESVRSAVERALVDEEMKRAAESVGARFAAHDSAAVFRRWVDEVVRRPPVAAVVG